MGIGYDSLCSELILLNSLKITEKVSFGINVSKMYT